MVYNIGDYTSPEALRKEVEKMNSFGARLTGSKAHKDYINYLKKQIEDMGITVYSDPYFFDRREEKNASVVLHNGNEDIDIPVSSAFPYSGETGAKGITAPLCYLGKKPVSLLEMRGKIAVIKVENLRMLPSEAAFDERRSYPEDEHLPKNYSGPVATSFVNFSLLKIAKTAGAKGVICIWSGITPELAKGQYLPFILDYHGIPAVWVDEPTGNKLIDAASKGQEVTLTLETEYEPNCHTESFYCMLDGRCNSEAVIINTHTDGTNCIEENGPAALIAMLRCLKDKPLFRRHIFVFTTGHFRLPDFKDIRGGGVQSTSKWLAAHPDLWDGRRGHIKAVAGVSVEHLGCLDWQEVNGEYVSTGKIAPELVYTGNKTMDNIYYKSLDGRSKVRTITLRGHNFLHFGEGQPLFNVRIPEISIVTAPDSLCVKSETAEMEKFDETLMLEQIQTFLNCVTELDTMSKKEIGKCDIYTFVK